MANWPIPAAMAGSRRTAARVTPGAISLSSSSHFAAKPYSNIIKPVALPPGRDRLSTKPALTGSGTITNTIGTVRVTWSNGATLTLPIARMTSGASATNSVAYLRMSAALPARPAGVDVHVAAVSPAQLLQPLMECKVARLSVRILRSGARKHADAPHALWLLRAHRHRPRCHCAAE